MHPIMRGCNLPVNRCCYSGCLRREQPQREAANPQVRVDRTLLVDRPLTSYRVKPQVRAGRLNSEASEGVNHPKE